MKRYGLGLDGVARFAVCAAMVFGCLRETVARSVSLDLRPAGKVRRLASAAPLPEDGVLRSSALAAGAADVGAVAAGDELSFTLFDDVTLTLTLKERMQSPLGGDAFLAEVAGYEGVKTAVVLRTEEGLTVDVQDFLNDKVYKVVSSPAGVKVSEIKPSHEGRCGCDTLAPPAAGGDAAAAPALKSARRLTAAGEQSDTCVDILVAYDKNAVVYANSNGGGITNFAQIAVQKMNAALANTGLDEKFRFRLVGVTSVNVSKTDVHEALYALDDEEDGWKDVKAARDAVGADIVTTLIDTGAAYGTTGVGWSLSSGMSPEEFGGNAYNVCAIRSVAQSDTMAHECGHNMGAGHSDVQSTQPGPQLYDYSSGYYFTSGGRSYSTIMAYGHENPNGGDATEIPYYSSPNHFYDGAAVGDSAHDNTLTLANTFSSVVKWRDRKVPMSYDVVFEPASGALIDGSLAVTLSPGKSGVEIRYTLDGSEPTATSPLYTGPITLTGTTTIKAVTVVDGTCSFPCEASYYLCNDIGYAMGLPEFSWTLDVPDTSLCGVQTTNAVDGIALGADVSQGDICSFSATISGPATITWKSQAKGNVLLQVLSDGVEVYRESWSGYSLYWSEKAVDLPPGEHTVEFRLGSRYNVTHYWLDDFRIYYTVKPGFQPVTTATAETAVTFTEEQMVTLVPPSDDCKVYYTLDGSDPNGADAILYEGPFFLSDSTRVRAITVQPGRGASAVVEGVYLKRVPPVPGEWTLWGEAAYEAARRDGRMIADLSWNYPGCTWSKALEPVITNPVFTDWAALNRVYLLAGSWGGKVGATGSRTWSLYSGTALDKELGGARYYPTFAFSSFSGDDVAPTCLGAMLARNDGIHAGIFYEPTAESLIRCFASFLSVSPLGAPVASATDAYNRTFPFSVTLSNTNGTGIIYYTLDGSTPTREKGMRYTGAISIPAAGTTLKAVVWPDGADAVSGVPFSITYQSLDAEIGVDGMNWTNDATLPWTVSRRSGVSAMDGGKKEGLANGFTDSTLKAEVDGPGVIGFKCKISTRGYSHLVFAVNGEEVATWSFANDEEFVYPVTSSGRSELTWTYRNYYYDSAYLGRISAVSWMPHVPPAAVSEMTASQGEYEQGTLLRWKEVAGATAYDIYRNSSENAVGATLMGTTEKCLYWDTECEAERTYWYWIRAVNKYGEGDFSPSASGWRPAVFRVSYSGVGGSGSMASQLCRRGGTVELSPNGFVREGYVFTGWAETEGGSAIYKPGDSVAVMHDLTLYAVWMVSPFRFGGSAQWMLIEDGVWQSGKIGNDASTWIEKTVFGPGQLSFDWNVSSESGYDILTFYLDGVRKNAISGTKGDWRKQSFTIDEPGGHTLKWEYKKDVRDLDGQDCGWVRNVAWQTEVTVAFDANGGSGGALVTGLSGSILRKPTVTREGHTFTEWIPAVPETLPETNATYTAQWQVNRYTVTFDANGGTGGTSVTQDYGTALAAPAVSREGYTFTGWSPVVPTTVLAGNATYTAQWQVNRYTVTFDANGGTGGTSVTQDYGTALAAPAVTRTGYTFTGWSPVVPAAVPAADATYTAQWQVNRYTVTFDANGGTGGTSVTRDFGTALAAPAVSREGYTFTGWSPVVPTTVLAGNATYTAQWQGVPYTVTFDANEGEVEEPARVVTNGDAVGELPVPTRDGYLFDGWFTETESGDQVTSETIVTGDVTFHARWHLGLPWIETRNDAVAEAAFLCRRILLVVGDATDPDTAHLVTNVCESSSIRERLDGGYVAWFNDGETEFNAVRPYLSDLEESAMPFVVVLDPWDMSTYVARSNGRMDADGFAAFLDGIPDGTEREPAQTCKVAFDAQSGDLGALSSFLAVVGGTVGALPVPTLAGHVFAGWWTEPEGGVEVTPATAVTEDLMLYARWEEAPEPEPAPAPFPALAFSATKAKVLDGAVYDAAGKVAGVIQLKVAKPNAKKHTTKVSGSLTLLDGKKRSLKAAMASVPADSPVKANLSVKGLGTLSVAIGNDGFAGTVGAYTVRSAKAGGKWTNASAGVTVAFAGGLPPGALESLLPLDVPVRVKGGKWVFDKAASVKLKKGALTVDTSKGRTNLSGLKLTYTPKTGLFKGSFKLYAIQGGKLKKFTVKVTGVVVDGAGTGVAKLAKPAATWNVAVE